MRPPISCKNVDKTKELEKQVKVDRGVTTHSSSKRNDQAKPDSIDFPSRFRQPPHTGHDHEATTQAVTHRLGTSFAAHCGSRSSNAHISAARSVSDRTRALANGDDDDDGGASWSAAAGSHALRNVDGVCAHDGER